MSTGAEVSVLGPRRWAVHRETAVRRAERPVVRLATFAALALYGVLRWETLMRPAPVSRLLGMLGLALVLAGLGAALSERHRALAIALAVVAVVAMFPIAGVPLSWVRHVRLEVGANAIGQGLTALPNVLVPYLGINPWVRVVVILGAGVLLLDAALLAAFAPRSLGDLRRAGAALPLVALAVVPTTLVKPHLPYVQGLILFALLTAFMWAEHAPTRDGATALAVVGIAGLGGLIAAPRIDPHHAWVNYEALAGSLAPGHVAAFDWSQRYGPLNWPQDNQEVLEVQAAHSDYWKAENLDFFDGRAWTAANVGAPVPVPDVEPAARARWSQTIQVTIRGMRTTDLIAAGSASNPVDVAEGALPGISAGTWLAGAPLHPGDTYRVRTYSPRPTAAQLQSAGTDYPQQLLPGYLVLTVPGGFVSKVGAVPPGNVYIPPFGGREAIVYGPTSQNAATALEASPYARAYALARRLAGHAATPYAFVESVLGYLSHGFTYDQTTPARKYPLESFLFKTKHGYCQQFAGAMALLLRMGGVPARVAVGFTPGTYDGATHEWVVDDIDAHAWVEAWFPGYGWVRFDPTPSVAPARGGHRQTSSGQGHGSGNSTSGAHGLTGPGTGVSHPRSVGGSSLPVLPAIAVALGVLGLALLVVRTLGRRPAGGDGELLAELERAWRRCGRPVADGVTLVALEQRLRSSPDAAAYVRAIRIERYGAAGDPPSSAQRRALRAQLAFGLGPVGRLRALWALPPRR